MKTAYRRTSVPLGGFPPSLDTTTDLPSWRRRLINNYIFGV